MSIAGVIATALRQEAPYQAEIAMGAQLIMDFQGARSGRRPYYWYRGTRYTSPEKIPGWSFSRNSEGYAEGSAGNLIKFPANAPRITDLGLLVEEARTETSGNSGFAGVTTGALTNGVAFGAGGFLFPSINGGVTATVVGAGSINNAPYIDIRVQGTPSGSPHFELNYQTGALAPAALTGEQWVNSIYAQLVEGSLAGVAATTLRAIEMTSANAVVVTQQSGITIDGVLSRKVAVLTLNGGATVAKARAMLAFSGSGVPVDYTIRLRLPNFQKAAFVTSPILTVGATATRAGDNASIAGQSGILAAPVTLAARAGLPAVDGVSRVLASLSGGSSDNRTDVRRNALNRASSVTFSGGSAQSEALSAATFTGAVALRGANRLRSSAVNLAVNGATPVSVSVTAPTGLGQLDLGRLFGGFNYLNGYLQLVMVLGDVDDAQLQRLTA